MDKNVFVPLTSEQTFMKEVFDDLDQKSRLKKYALLIEAVFEAFGLPVRIVEIDIQPDSYLYSAKPQIEMDAKDIVKHGKDLALALANPTESIRISAPIQRDLIGIYLPRVNTIGQQAQEARNDGLCKPIGTFTRGISKQLIKISRIFFRRYQKNYVHKDERYSIIAFYRKQFRKLNNNLLMEAFNKEVGAAELTRERASCLAAMQFEFDRRNLDYSNIASINTGLSFDNRIRLIGKKIGYEKASSESI